MQLKKVRIQDFRCIENSEEFSIDGVTCLVGKNESGKTSILKALHKLKSGDDAVELFEPAQDYPKRKWRPNIAVPVDPPAISTEWILEEKDFAAIEKRYGKGVIQDNAFRISRGYDNLRRYSININEQVLIKNLMASAGFDSEEKKQFVDAKTVDALKKALESNQARTTNQNKLLQKLQDEFKKNSILTILDYVDSMVPAFLYFDQYLRLPGVVSVDALIRRKNENKLTNEDRIFLALLSLAGTTIETLHGAKTFEEFTSALRAVSNQISEQIFKYWTQNRHLDVSMKMDQARLNDPPPFNSGYVFRTRIDNRRHKADTGFDERSSGFVWFFSFLIWFYQLSETYKKNLIILLDEPGLTLHARAQADLLRYINEQLKPDYQVIYTTHSPFMIDPDNLLAARTVEDVVVKDKATGDDVLLGTKVKGDVLSTDPDTVSPLQRALDYELTQTLFIGRHTVLVEGPSDFLYLKWFTRQLQNSGKIGIDYRWSISIVGGVDRIPGFVSLFRGNRLNIAAIVDVQSGQKQKIENARKTLDKGHLLTADLYADSTEADIEDVLGREFYISLVNMAYELRPSEELAINKQSEESCRVIREVESHFAMLPPRFPEFNHFKPAEYLYQSADQCAKLPGFDLALKRMDKLITDLNALID